MCGRRPADGSYSASAAVGAYLCFRLKCRPPWEEGRGMLSEQQRSELISLTQRLVQAPSLTGQEERVAEVIRHQMEMMGYHEVHVDDWGNVIGVLRGRGRGSVLFDGHMDTVPWVAPEWKHAPLGGTVSDGRIWGRGTSDMKGAIAAAVYGVGLLADHARDLGTVYVSCSVCEEPAEGPMLVEVCEQFRPVSAVIMEPSELRVNIGQRGRAELVVRTPGLPAHSSSPHLGRNAVKAMARLLQAVETLALPEDSLLGPAILEVTDVKSEPYPGLSVVPSACQATFDRRLLVQDTPESVVQELRTLAAATGVEAEIGLVERGVRTYTGREYTHQVFAPAWKTPPDSPLVTAAVAALQRVDQPGRLGKYSFCTNGSGSAGRLGIPTIGYGPGREAEAHIIDEFLDLDQLVAAAEGYQALAVALSRLSS